VTITYGDIQMAKKASDTPGVRSDFEIIVRLADRMGHRAQQLVPFGPGLRADLGQSRGAQAGEADRHALWLAANNLEPKLSPFDPFATLDEIQRLVPSYSVSRFELLSGQAKQERVELVQITEAPAGPDLVLPSNDTLFTSGSMTRWSHTLNSVMERRTTPRPSETAAD
jgi:hypothetical protein